MIANFHVTAMCDDCQNALLGIVRQGFVCQRKKIQYEISLFTKIKNLFLGCKLICHPDCMEKIATPCRPSIKDRSKDDFQFFFFIHLVYYLQVELLYPINILFEFQKQAELKKAGININY